MHAPINFIIYSSFETSLLCTLGVKVTSERQLIHDLHRQHLVTLLKSSFQEHYSEVISMLLNLTNLEVLDANIWMDIINSFLPTDIGKLGLTCTTLEIASKCSNFALVNKRKYLGYTLSLFSNIIL